MLAAAFALAALGCTPRGPRTDAPMVTVPAGEFQMGCTENLGGCMTGGMDLPAHAVILSAFEIDKTEVTQAAYAECVAARACTRPSGGSYTPDSKPTLPVAEVSWDQAARYCAWAGKRLPTEAEWEKAARGTDARMYPWGDTPPTCDLATFEGCGDGPRPVGATPAGASPCGALDLAGNVQEWVADFFSSTYYAVGPVRDPVGPERGDSGHAVRGGGYAYDAWHLRSAVRLWDPGAPADDLGFRCARTLPARLSACPEDDVLEALHDAVFFLEHRRDEARVAQDLEQIRRRVTTESRGAAMVLPLTQRIAALAARDDVAEPESELIRDELHASPCLTAEAHQRFHRALLAAERRRDPLYRADAGNSAASASASRSRPASR